MNKLKKLTKLGAMATVAILLVSTLAGCGGGSGSNSSNNSADAETDTYKGNFLADPTSFDYVFSMKGDDSWHTCNLVEGLMEYDPVGQLRGSLAKSWKVSEDGRKYTYKLRDNLKWITSDGSEYDKVKAKDWITSLKHAVEQKSEMLYIVQNSIKGLDDYIKGNDKDFSHVGVKALDDTTLEYTLNAPENFWQSKCTYGILSPVNEAFLKSKGKDFGKLSPDSILYNGPYILSNFTSKSLIEFKANDNYWDKKNVHIKNVHLTYFDGKNQDELFKQFQSGTYTQVQVFPTSAAYKDVEKSYPKSVTLSPITGFTRYLAFNYRRSNYKNTNKKGDDEKEATTKALRNKNFRAAFRAALNKADFNAQEVGSQYGKQITRNILTPAKFVQTNDGKTFAELVQDEIDQSKEKSVTGFKAGEGNNSTFDSKRAKELFATAKSELEADGVKKFPIKIDYPIDEADKALFDHGKALKQSIEKVLGKDNVEINLTLMNSENYKATTYTAKTSDQCDYDIVLIKWSADYADPSSYMNIFDSRKGDVMWFMGLDPTDSNPEQADAVNAVAEQLGLDHYNQLLDQAAAINEKDQVDERYKAYAKAEAWIAENTFAIPVFMFGVNPQLTKVKPFTVSYAFAGSMQGVHRYKYQELQKDPVSEAQYNKAKKAWQKKNDDVDNNI